MEHFRNSRNKIQNLDIECTVGILNTNVVIKIIFKIILRI